MPWATAHKASYRKSKHTPQLLALQQGLEDQGTTGPHSEVDLTVHFPPLQAT